MSGDVVRLDGRVVVNGEWSELRKVVDAADHDAAVAAARLEVLQDAKAAIAAAREEGWNTGARAALEDLHPHSPFCVRRSPEHCTCGNTAWVDSLIAALRKPVGGGD